MSPLNITQPLGIWSNYNGYYKVMSNIPKMGQLPTPVKLMASAASAFPLNAPQDCLMPLLERVLSQSLGPSRGEVAKKYEPFKYRSSQPRKISKLNKLNAQF